MKFKKNYPFLDEVTAHGELFKGPREVFICPECGSEHVKMGEIAEFGLPNEGIFEVMETRRECTCRGCSCRFRVDEGRKIEVDWWAILAILVSILAVLFVIAVVVITSE